MPSFIPVGSGSGREQGFSSQTADGSIGVRTELMHVTLKSPPLCGLYPAVQPRVHWVALGSADGQSPGVSGRDGVGCEQTSEVEMMHLPAGAEKLPRVHVTASDPFATYPIAHPRTQVLLEGVDAPHPPTVVLGTVRIGDGHGDGSHVPAAVENDPKLHVMESDPPVAV